MKGHLPRKGSSILKSKNHQIIFVMFFFQPQAFFQLASRKTRPFEVCTQLIGSFRRYTRTYMRLFTCHLHADTIRRPSKSVRPTPFFLYIYIFYRIKFEFHGRIGFTKKKNQFQICNSNLSGESENTHTRTNPRRRC